MEGLVYKSTGSWYSVKDTEGRWWNARIKGTFRQDGLTSTNPLAVGDIVDIVSEYEGENTATITGIHERRNYINRLSPKGRHQQHIVAANLDQSLLIATLRDPRTSTGFIDRFLVTCEMYHVPAILLFNKADLYRDKEWDLYAELEEIYTNVGYQVQLVSLLEGKGIEEVSQLLHHKTTLVSGHSGVGKSSFINRILPGKGIKTQDVSGWSGKGQHTTTFAEMYDLPSAEGGRIIDTPGLKEFGLVNISKSELSGYFPEMRERLNGCQFNNCLHMNEPGCAIKEAVRNGEISEERYVNYATILDTIDEKKY
ncbi:ribosome small subunit-dependent GTPase A [Flaviaesturariibacter flavus]|uniref:Small ribosomal subunit biogenesis GTPase RsgA n=1 Tax=Flaviaesturariibacter flavus TaxID=2502780 RepID=A0A4R1BBC8_9BACT|nr:ribosome small subunit-dependent GTPase A [Flaviaesturariibacter flavus]TCJ14289.1 ribosome small subunit-dependent GTPase A [Flaviaesturariibacter flavus]